MIDTLAGHMARLETTAASRWPTGSRWRHVSLGVVTVVGLTHAHNSPSPEQVGTVWYHRVCEPTPQIVDAAGRRWSCYAPGDLAAWDRGGL